MTGTGAARVCFSAAVALSFLAGCIAVAQYPSSSDLRTNALPSVGIADSLLAASDEDEGFVELLTPPTPGPPPEKPERANRFGLRLGYLATVAAEETGWNPAVCAGVYYRRAKPPSSRSVLEIGFDYIPLEREDGSVSTTLYQFRGEMLFGKWNSQEGKTSFYFLGGGDLVSEQGTQEASGTAGSNFVGGINLGLGFGSTKGSWDVRAVYSLFPGSPNVKGNVLVAAGFSF